MRRFIGLAAALGVLLGAQAAQAATITWNISVFDLTGVLTGNTYSGTVSVDDSYISPGLQVLTPDNSDLSIVFNFLDEDGITPRQYTEGDDPDYPAFPALTLFTFLDGSTIADDLNYVYVDANFDRVWGFGSFSYEFNGGGEGSYSLTPSGVTPVPEPTTLLLLGSCIAAATLRRVQRQRAH